MQPPVADVHGNDHRAVWRMPVTATPTVSVVVPVYERVELLERTLAALAHQAGDVHEVCVADDGSSQDVASAVAAAASNGLAARHLPHERDGYGAARVRNSGAAAASGDVLLFLDADCIPTPGLVAAHAAWHARASNVVVVGSRRDADSSGWTPDDLRAGRVDLHGAVGAAPEDRRIPSDGWRAMFQRRSKDLLLGQEAFRAAISANLSVAAWLFDHVGGFDEGFGAWGGEDTELAWRLWNEGAVIAPEDRALAVHQVQLDRTDRAADRAETLGVVADLVPAAFYRPRPTPLAVTPRVSWVVRVEDEAGVARAEEWVAAAAPADVELVLHGPTGVLASRVAAAARNPRRTVVADDDSDAAAEAAIAATRGALLVLLHAAAEQPGSRVVRAVRSLDAAAGTDVARVAYVVGGAGGDRYLRLDELAAVDEVVAAGGLPVFAVVRRRALARQLHVARSTGAARPAAAAWTATRTAVTPELAITDPLRLRTDATLPSPGVPRARDLAAVGVREAARAAVRAARSRAGGAAPARAPASPGPGADDDRVPVEYVGLTGQQNLGDDAVRIAIERLMPWARFGVDVPDARMLLVGGGTLLNGKRYYQTRMLRHDSPVLERALFGTGVRSPAYWGVTEPMDEWFSFIDTALHASVRGPDSVANLRELGYADELPIIGDPAFSLRPSEHVERRDGLVVLCPVWTSGNCHGGDDGVVFDAFAATIRRLRAEGREVLMLSAFPQDDRHCIDLMRQAGVPDMPYVAGYDSVDDCVDLLAGADLVIGERLHAAILAASAGTPFVALEYRPKVRDFGRSVDQEDAVLRTDEMQRLDEVVDTVLAQASVRTATVASHVERYRTLQRQTADALHKALIGER